VVVQPTTGRPGKEWLCLISPGLLQASAAEQGRILQWMREKFTELQGQAESFDWATVRGESTTWPALTIWQAEAQSFFPKDTTLESLRVKDTPRLSIPRRYLIVGAIPLGASSLLLGIRGAWKLLPRFFEILFTSGRAKGTDFAPLAEALGLEPNSSPEDIARKLSQAVSPSVPKGPTASAEDQIGDILRLIDTEVNKTREDRNRPARELAKYGSVLRAVERLFPKERSHEFDPLGLIRSEEPDKAALVAWAQGMDYPQLVAFLKELAKLSKKSPQEKEDKTKDGKCNPSEPRTRENCDPLQDLSDLVDGHKKQLEDLPTVHPKRRFFLPEDFESLRLAEKATRSLAKLCNLSQPNSWADFLRSCGEVRNTLDGLISQLEKRLEMLRGLACFFEAIANISEKAANP
jgi:hypothetical protein